MFGDFNDQIDLCAKQKFKFLSATDVYLVTELEAVDQFKLGT